MEVEKNFDKLLKTFNKFSVPQDETLSRHVIGITHLSMGLDLAISELKKGEISDAARKDVRKLIGDTYYVFSKEISVDILKKHKVISDNIDASKIMIAVDLPDDKHDDLIIMHKLDDKQD